MLRQGAPIFQVTERFQACKRTIPNRHMHQFNSLQPQHHTTNATYVFFFHRKSALLKTCRSAQGDAHALQTMLDFHLRSGMLCCGMPTYLPSRKCL